MMLADLQHTFLKKILKPSCPDDMHWINARHLSAEKHLSIYRDSVVGGLVVVLASTYALSEKLVGQEFFHAMARIFIDTDPCQEPYLDNYGVRFPDFIADFKHASSLPYLPDVARLEWAHDCAYCGPDNGEPDFLALSQLSDDAVETVRFRLPYGGQLLASPYPIHQIWERNRNDYTGDRSISLDEGGVRLLIWRRGCNVRIEPLNEEQWQFLSAFSHSQALTTVCEQFENTDMAASLPNLLQYSLQQGWLSYMDD